MLDRFGALLRVAQLVVREAGQHGLVGIRLRGDVLVPFLNEQPFLLSLLELDQRPTAAQLVALQVEKQFPRFESLVRVLERLPHAAVPYDHGAGAVVALRDDSLEVAVLERVIFDFDRQAFVGGIGRGALGNRPRSEDAVHFETQIPVQPRGVVHVHDQQATLLRTRLGDQAPGLGSLIERALGAILRQRIGCGCRFRLGHQGSAEV